MTRRFTVHAIIGTLVSVVLFGVPGAPAVGSGVASYLEGDDLKRGMTIGTAVGLASASAVALFYVTVFRVVLAPGLDYRVVPTELGGSLFLVLFIYSIVLGAGGGLIGSFAKARLGKSAIRTQSIS